MLDQLSPQDQFSTKSMFCVVFGDNHMWPHDMWVGLAETGTSAVALARSSRIVAWESLSHAYGCSGLAMPRAVVDMAATIYLPDVYQVPSIYLGQDFLEAREWNDCPPMAIPQLPKDTLEAFIERLAWADPILCGRLSEGRGFDISLRSYSDRYPSRLILNINIVDADTHDPVFCSEVTWNAIVSELVCRSWSANPQHAVTREVELYPPISAAVRAAMTMRHRRR